VTCKTGAVVSRVGGKEDEELETYNLSIYHNQTDRLCVFSAQMSLAARRTASLLPALQKGVINGQG
jgi:hypothetical protein